MDVIVPSHLIIGMIIIIIIQSTCLSIIWQLSSIRTATQLQTEERQKDGPPLQLLIKNNNISKLLAIRCDHHISYSPLSSQCGFPVSSFDHVTINTSSCFLFFTECVCLVCL